VAAATRPGVWCIAGHRTRGHCTAIKGKVRVIRNALSPGTYLGSACRTWHAGNLTLTESWYPRGAELPPHAHACPHLCVVLDGDYTEAYGRRKQRRAAGEVIFLPRDVAHAERHASAGRHFLVEWKDVLFDKGDHRYCLPEEPKAIDSAAASGLVVRIKSELRAEDPWRPIMLEALALELLATSTRCLTKSETPSPSPWVKDVQHMLQSRLAEPLTLVLVAQAVGLHPAYLARAYRARTGESVMETLRRVRVGAAADRLARTRMPISQVAAETGFCDQSHLTRTFVKQIGATPLNFRVRNAPQVNAVQSRVSRFKTDR
jgi:AraC family transcriptional regulator